MIRSDKGICRPIERRETLYLICSEKTVRAIKEIQL